MKEWDFKHFKREEFSCKCGCKFDDIDFGLVSKLDLIRNELDIPLKINSGCRCKTYNEKVGGEPDSAHTKGKAADIEIDSSVIRYAFLQLALNMFNRVGIYDTFCHVDVDEELPQRVVWVGKK